jgi:hypothetical protein
MIKDLFSWIPAITYLVVIGEAMALLFGLMITKSQSAWNTRKNQIILKIHRCSGANCHLSFTFYMDDSYFFERESGFFTASIIILVHF